jgi:predicted transcriptional regulator
MHAQRLATTGQAKVTAQKSSNRAGATQYKTGRSRLKVQEIAPYVLAAKEFRRTACMRRRMQLVRQDCMSKGDDHLPLLKAQPKQPKSATIQIRVEEDVKLRLDKYAEFIDSSAAYVVTEALKLLFNKDGEFRSWLGQHADNSEAQNRKSKVAISKGESVQLALK